MLHTTHRIIHKNVYMSRVVMFSYYSLSINCVLLHQNKSPHTLIWILCLFTNTHTRSLRIISSPRVATVASLFS